MVGGLRNLLINKDCYSADEATNQAVPTKNAIRRSSVANRLNIIASEEVNSADLGFTAVFRCDWVVSGG